LLLGLLALALGVLARRDRRAAGLLGGAVLLFALGYTTYATLYVRSGLNPAIDENDPETWAAFLRFVNREQYGTESMLLGMFTARASRVYQFWHLQSKYFLQQFAWPWAAVRLTFRQATEALPDQVAVSLLPYGLGLAGLLWHAWRDWRHWLALLVLFLVMGVGLSLYLNMPDPQPRERHYVFGGMYLAFAIWIGLGWTAAVEALRQRGLPEGRWLALAAAVGLVLPAGSAASLYHRQDRTGDYIAADYAYNLLQSCQPHSLLFTNGDNDTFPLWYLQEVEGVRRDVRVINLSLLNTNWYIKQLRDRPPQVDLRYSDTYIDSVLTDTQQTDLLRRYWPEPKTVRLAGLEWELRDLSGYQLLRVQDVMVLKIIEWNEWKRPLHFAITVPASNRLGLEPYLRMEGMTLRLVQQRDMGPDAEALARNLFEVYRFRGLSDPAVYKDRDTERLLGNYRACVFELATAYRVQERTTELVSLMDWAERNILMGWEGYYLGADALEAAGELDRAGRYLENAAQELLDRYGVEQAATYSTIAGLAGVLVNPPYRQFDRAARVYRALIRRDPAVWNGYHDLAVTLQMAGDEPGALAVVAQYLAHFGPQQQMLALQQALQGLPGEAAAAPAATDTAP